MLRSVRTSGVQEYGEPSFVWMYCVSDIFVGRFGPLLTANMANTRTRSGKPKLTWTEELLVHSDRGIGQRQGGHDSPEGDDTRQRETDEDVVYLWPILHGFLGYHESSN